jgi:uncharacterized protein (TIGR03067 family)
MTTAELAQFQGAWRAVAVEIDGSPLPRHLFELARLEITGDRFVLSNPLPDAEQRVEGSLKVDPTRTPKELDLRLDNGQVFKEIYELESDELRVCYPLRAGPRPTTMSTGAGSGLSLVLYRRE